LLPKKSPHPVFASETTRNNTAAGSTVLPVYNLSGGPTGNGDVHFNRTYGQFIEAGVRPFNMSTNGGFSIVTVLRFNGVLFESEPILEFTNSPSQSDRIYLGTTEYSNLILSITQGNKHCEFKVQNSIMSGTWLTIIAKFFSSKNRIDLTIHGRARSFVCANDVVFSDTVFQKTRIGKSEQQENTLNADIAGLFVVDVYPEHTVTTGMEQNITLGHDLISRWQPRLLSTGVTAGVTSGHGAANPVFFVGGTTTTKMQWGPLSVPAEFTMCSVTRYSGEDNFRILTCYNNPQGHSNVLHGHHANTSGPTLYGNGQDNSNLYPNSISPHTDWVVVCGRNTKNPDSINVLVNEMVRAVGVPKGGLGSCAMGINYHFTQVSDWQLSKLYIWDHHLSDSDFAAVSSSLYAQISRGTTDGVCLVCPKYSQSLDIASECECVSGAYPADARRPSECTPCLPGTFKILPGPHLCSPCPLGTYGAGVSCLVCPAGTYGGGAECTLCPPGTYGTLSGQKTRGSCKPCQKGTYNEVAGAISKISCLLCASGKFHRKLGADSKDYCENCKCLV
jgi:hypothetical protein